MADARGFAGSKILVVEDDYMIASELVYALHEEGAEVIGPAASIEAAIQLVRTAPEIAGALLDVSLRGEMSFLVADALLARGVPLVFVTGYEASVIPVRYADVPHCEKPVDLARVARDLFG